MDKNYEIGNFITFLRKEKKLTQSKLGKLVGVSNKAISKWENGQGLPEPKYMKKLCEVLEITIDELLEGKRQLLLENEALDDLYRLEHVYKYYNNDSRVEIGLEDISLKFKLGEIIAITGVSGSGKTTLINMVGGFDSFENGEIYINNDGISKYDSFDYENYRKKYISVVFQDYGILERYSILNNLILIRLLMNDSYKEAKKKSLEIIKEIGFLRFKNKKASKLSGGQKQKLAVARAILKDAPIILGDEITANLDSSSGKEILELLFSHAKDKLILLVTHHYEQIEKYVTRKITLSEGKVIEDKKIKEAPYSTYKDTPSIKKNDFLLASLFTMMQVKNNFFHFLYLFIILLFGGVLLFGGNIIGDYFVSDYNINSQVKENTIIEVKKNDYSILNETDIKVFKNIKGTENIFVPKLYSARTYIEGIGDNHSNRYHIMIDDTLDFGECIISSINQLTYFSEQCCLSFYTDEINSIPIYYQLKCVNLIRPERIILENNIVYLSYSTLNYIQSTYNIQKDFKIKNTNFGLSFESNYAGESKELFAVNKQLIIDLTDSCEDLTIPKSWFNLNEKILTAITENPMLIWKNNLEIKVSLTEENLEYAKISYTFFEDLEIQADSLYVICSLNQIMHVDQKLSKLGYYTFKEQDIEFPLENPALFFRNSAFFGISIALALSIYVLLKISLKKIIKMKKREFVILKKVGFSNKTIYLYIILPILISAILVLIASSFIYLVRPFRMWYYYLLPFGSFILVIYNVCKSIFENYDSILKEEK